MDSEIVNSGVAMSALRDEHPLATHFVWLAASSQDGNGPFLPPPKTAFAWALVTRDGETYREGSNALRNAVEHYQAAAMLDAMMEMLTKEDIAPGSHLHVISDVKYFRDILNEDRAIRQASNYFRWSSSSKPRNKPLAQSDRWRGLDDLLDRLHLIVSAGSPSCDESRFKLIGTKNWAEEVRRNIGRSPSDWNT